MRGFRRRLFGISSLVALAACGGGGGGGDAAGLPPVATLTGQFVDSNVEGLSYQCGAASGITSATGQFQYEAGSSCTFKIGGITIGVAAAAPVLTPVSLVAGALDETDPTVVNITRLLVSLDSDANPANGITISSAVRDALAGAALSVSADAATFVTQAASVVAQAISGRALASSAAASAHLRDTLLGRLAGNYNCSYQGASAGNVTIAIAAGLVTGNGSNFTLAGAVSSSGSATITGGATSTGATFTGTFKPDGTGSGNWTDVSVGNGTWTCTRA